MTVARDVDATPCVPPWFDSLTKFLVEEKGFNPDRVARGIEKLKKARGVCFV